ncbi:MAG: amino acid ABC transporter substrate-binding protein [Peptoniphilaceae bacterium]|nr:amino acid ABC transporter substrate-binding protein [Peptoniphilaceae bacterium]MDY6019006.1 amino acid ABC transporter substrate-binding protein [Anaerococcus sp.]
MFKKICFILLAQALCFGFVGCKKNDKNPDNAIQSGKDKKELIVGVDNSFVPMGFLDQNNKITGFDVELARQVFKRLDKKVKFENIDWATKEASLDRGSIDLIWNGYSINDQRKKLVAYTDSYMKNRTIVVVMADSSIKNMADLKDKELATQQGSTAYESLDNNKAFKNSLKNKDASQYDTFDKALRDMEVGRIQGVLGDEVLIKYYISQKGKEKYRILDGDLGSESYVVAFRKADRDLRDKVNKALKEVKDDGTFQKIYDKWFNR